MKIVHVINSIVSGGAEIFVKNLSIKQKELGNHVEIWSIYKGKNEKFEEEYIKELEKHKIGVKLFDKKRNGEKLQFLKSLRAEVKSSAPDIINNHFERMAYMIALAVVDKKVKIISTIHSTKVIEKEVKILSKLEKLKLIHGFVGICSETEEVLKALGIRNIITIKNGIDLGRFTCERDINKDIEKIIAIGRLEEVKNHEYLIFSYKKVIDIAKKDKVNVPILEIYGEGKLKNYLQEFITFNKLGDYVKLMGYKKDIENILKTSDLYIISSLYEGLSISLIEAMATSIPIIATNVGGNSEIIIDKYNGFLVESNNVDEMSDRILMLLQSKDLRRIFFENCNKEREKYMIINTAKDYCKYYSYMLGD